MQYGHAANEQFVHPLVGIEQGIPCIFHQRLFETEMRLGVIDHVVDRFGHGATVALYLGNPEGIDVINNAFVLLIDHINARFERGTPLDNFHRYSPVCLARFRR